MIKVEQELMKSIHALQREPNFYKLTTFLEEEYAFSLKGLMTASKDKIQPLQGRTLLLTELLDLFKHNR